MYKTKKIVLSFCLISVSLAVSAQNKKLHNGIVYPNSGLLVMRSRLLRKTCRFPI